MDIPKDTVGAFAGCQRAGSPQMEYFGAVLFPRCTPISILLCRVKG